MNQVVPQVMSYSICRSFCPVAYIQLHSPGGLGGTVKTDVPLGYGEFKIGNFEVFLPPG